MGAHRRHEVGIRRAIEAAVGDDHAERGQHRKVPPEALAADRIEETIRHAVIVSSGSQPTRCWREMDSNSRSPVSGDTPQRPLITSPAITFRESSACASHRRLRPLCGNPPSGAGLSSKLSQSPGGSATTLSLPANRRVGHVILGLDRLTSQQLRWIASPN